MNCPTCGIDVLEHPANRCLDAWVAEKILGIVLCDHEEDKYGKCSKCGLNKSYWERITPPRYHSVDIAAAWEVVEKMHELGYWAQIRTPFGVESNLDNWCGFTPHETTGWNGKPDNWTNAETIPSAICRAALLAVEAKK
jgi:hypothetical protein